MSEADPLNAADVEVLRAASHPGRPLPSEQREQLAALADRIAPAVRLPPTERGTALQQLLRRPDVDLVQGAATHLHQDTDGPLAVLARKLRAYLPPKNGG